MSKSSTYRLVFGLAMAVVILGVKLHAQADGCSVPVPVNVSCTGFCLTDAPPTTQCPPPPQCEGMAGCLCYFKTSSPACTLPNLAKDKSCPACDAAARIAVDARVGAPIYLATGNTYIVESDIQVPGLGGGMSLTRTWNSISPIDSPGTPFMFGRNWRSNYEERVFVGSDGYLKYAQGNGTVMSYGVSSNSPGVATYTRVAPSMGGEHFFTDRSKTNTTLTSPSGENRTFDSSSGRLLSISDRNGNTTQLTYDSSNRLVVVTDPALRKLYFNYAVAGSTLVSSVTSDVGITFSYTYDDQGRLTKVTRPDNTTISYQFDANSNITAVLDNEGKVLESHTYDAVNRGLTSSRANGIDAVTVTYP